MLAKIASFGSWTALLPMLSALFIAIIVVRLRRRRARHIRLKVILRVLFTPRIWLSRSALLDIQYVLAGAIAFGAFFSVVSISDRAFSDIIYNGLVYGFGSTLPEQDIPLAGKIALALALYIAYEFAYWFDHYLSHKVPFLWEFHKVHHSAQVLIPFTNYRVHPVDTLLFVSMVAVIMGGMHGIIHYSFGDAVAAHIITYVNLIIAVHMALYGHLQHSQLWIPFTGRWGKIFLSPAHHQIHHSSDRQHFDKNFGAALSVFDWLFGTLHIPTRQPQKITFGVGDASIEKGLISSLVKPCIRALRHLKPTRTGGKI